MTDKPRLMSSIALGTVAAVGTGGNAGQVTVSFPWLDASYLTDWVPVGAPMAGSGRGAFLMPESGDEVIVGFDRGSFDNPYIVGFLWNGKDQPPETDVKNRTIQSVTGHQLLFADGDKKIVITSAGKLVVTMDDNTPSIALTTPGGLSVTLDDSQSAITLSGGGRIMKLQGGMVQIT